MVRHKVTVADGGFTASALGGYDPAWALHRDIGRHVREHLWGAGEAWLLENTLHAEEAAKALDGGAERWARWAEPLDESYCWLGLRRL